MLLHKTAYPIGYAVLLSYSVFVISSLRIPPYSEVSFFYCDPPYYSTEGYYQNVGFTTADHKRLRDTLAAIKGKFLVSYNDCPEIRELYRGYEMYSYERLNNIRQRFDGGSMFGELLIANYDLNERLNSDQQISLYDLEDQLC